MNWYFAEERFIECKFGQIYLDWPSKAPAFIPGFKHLVKAPLPLSMTTVLRRESSGVLNTVIGFLFVNVLRYDVINGGFKFFTWQRYLPGVTLVLILILRTLKRTGRLNEEGRS